MTPELPKAETVTQMLDAMGFHTTYCEYIREKIDKNTEI